MIRTAAPILASLGLYLGLVACDGTGLKSGTAQKGTTPAAGKPTASSQETGGGIGDATEDEEQTSHPGSGGTSGGKGAAPTSPQTAHDAAKATQDVDFSAWCQLSGETAPIKGRLQSLWGNFCDGTKPKTLLTSSLIAKAYTGSGEPTLTAIAPLGSSGATTSYTFAVAIKLPISIKDHFDKVGPRGGDVAALKKQAELTGATATIEILETHMNEGLHQVRGWLVHSTATKNVLITQVVTESQNRSDQFLLKEGQLYLYTQYVQKPIQTIKQFDMVSAGVQIGQSGYLIAVISAAVDNLGLTAPAEDEVRRTAIAGVKYMYDVAAQ